MIDKLLDSFILFANKMKLKKEQPTIKQTRAVIKSTTNS